MRRIFAPICAELRACSQKAKPSSERLSGSVLHLSSISDALIPCPDAAACRCSYYDNARHCFDGAYWDTFVTSGMVQPSEPSLDPMMAAFPDSVSLEAIAAWWQVPAGDAQTWGYRGVPAEYFAAGKRADAWWWFLEEQMHVSGGNPYVMPQPIWMDADLAGRAPSPAAAPWDPIRWVR